MKNKTINRTRWHTNPLWEKIQKTSLDTPDKRLAKEIEAKIRIEIVEGKHFEKAKSGNKTFHDMMEKFMKEHAPKVSPSILFS